MNPKLLSVFLTSISVLCSAETVAQTQTRQVTTTTLRTTTTVISETVVKEKVKWTPFNVCVLDFTSADIEGQKRFLDHRNQPILIPTQSTLTDADRNSMSKVMQGYVKMIDAWDTSSTNSANRAAQIDDNIFSRQKALNLYQTIVKGQSRPMVIGADYLSAYLGKYNDVFSCTDKNLCLAAMQNLQQSADFPQDFMLKLAKQTGITHLIYGTISDLRIKRDTFKGYGIETNTTSYQLDVIIKMVDLVKQRTVYSNVYTGVYKIQKIPSTSQISNDIFHNLMTSALQQAAEDFYDICKPGRKNKVSVTPLPARISFDLTAAGSFNPKSAEIYFDGKYIGNGTESFNISGGTYDVEIKAAGYKTKTLRLEVNSDRVIKITMEK
ncbi:MAG: PEGA domain-containing protein [Lentisphaeria bacterium]|nr:PEGA domain-containing protein [Lentisphaeria bacterium]